MWNDRTFNLIGDDRMPSVVRISSLTSMLESSSTSPDFFRLVIGLQSLLRRIFSMSLFSITHPLSGSPGAFSRRLASSKHSAKNSSNSSVDLNRSSRPVSTSSITPTNCRRLVSVSCPRVKTNASRIVCDSTMRCSRSCESHVQFLLNSRSACENQKQTASKTFEPRSS
jgi:hypothetical protein